jgi:uncharacterized protein YbjT (DUF2867 family)
VIAGASGFVGRALVDALAPSREVIAISRGGGSNREGVTWRACDLYNPVQTEEALAGADVAVYLVHSMMPSARLTQASFEELDLLCADNFARAAAKNGIKHIVYLGGLLPAAGTTLSRHLESRSEVERALAAHGASVTTLRAGLVLGAGGSSFEIMANLVRKLPVMLGPLWTRSLTQPIALRDVITLLLHAIERPDLAGRAYDIGGPDVVTYAELLRLTGAALGKRTRVMTLPVRTMSLSLLWVSAITGASQALVRPLVESLSHDMIATDGLVFQQEAGLRPQPLREALAEAVKTEQQAAPSGGTGAPRRRVERGVVSIQRLRISSKLNAFFVAEEYARWLPRFFRPLLRVTVDASRTCRFFARPLREPLLILAFDPEHSSPDRQLFRVTGGLLAGDPGEANPRLEFRAMLDGTHLLAVVQDFVPRLPWPIYLSTQSLGHLAVMWGFGRHLASLS